MGKIRVNMNSFAAYEKHCKLDVISDNVKVIDNYQLSDNIPTQEFDMDLSTGRHNIIFNLLNAPQPLDKDGDGEFNHRDAGDQIAELVITSLEMSTDEVNYTALLPSNEIFETDADGNVVRDENGHKKVLQFSLSSFRAFGQSEDPKQGQHGSFIFDV